MFLAAIYCSALFGSRRWASGWDGWAAFERRDCAITAELIGVQKQDNGWEKQAPRDADRPGNVNEELGDLVAGSG